MNLVKSRSLARIMIRNRKLPSISVLNIHNNISSFFNAKQQQQQHSYFHNIRHIPHISNSSINYRCFSSQNDKNNSENNDQNSENNGNNNASSQQTSVNNENIQENDHSTTTQQMTENNETNINNINNNVENIENNGNNGNNGNNSYNGRTTGQPQHPHIQSLFRRWQRKLTMTVVATLASVFAVVWYFWDDNPYFNIRPHISSPLSQVATDAISTQDLQRQATIASKNLLNDLFKDEKIQFDTTAFFITILNEPALLNKLTNLFESLLSQDIILEKLKSLVISVINDEIVVNELINLISFAISHPTNKQMLLDTIHEILDDNEINQHAATMTSDTINKVLSDEQVKEIAIRFLDNVLHDEIIQESSSNTLYKVVVGALTPKMFRKGDSEITGEISGINEENSVMSGGISDGMDSKERGGDSKESSDVNVYEYEKGVIHGEVIEIHKKRKEHVEQKIDVEIEIEKNINDETKDGESKEKQEEEGEGIDSVDAKPLIDEIDEETRPF